MRPVNLIPSNERRGDSSVSRTGPIAYLLIGMLVAVLGCVSALVLTGNEISDKKTELEELKAENTAEQARAASLAAYTQFRGIREQRALTISGLADSRFDWERVIRELSLVLPPDVWLSKLNATASPGVVLDGGAEVAGRDAVAGPALEIIGCAPSQARVAAFVAVARDIDGVTRVGLPSSLLPGGSSTEGEGCQTRDFIAQFEMVLAFDAAPVSASTTAPPVTAPTTEATPTSTETG